MNPSMDTPESALVERFIEIGNWPTSRKTVLWAGILLSLFVLGWATRHGIGGSGTPGEFVLFDTIIGAWMAAAAISLLISLPAARAGRQARWTAHVFTILFASPVVAMVYLFDSVGEGAAPLAFVPVVVLFVTVFYDEHFGAVALLYVIGACFTIAMLEGSVLPSGRSWLEAAGPAATALGVSSLLTLLFTTGVAMAVVCMLVVMAFRAKEARLLVTLERAIRNSAHAG
jgi:hypothetical protein